VSRYPTKWLSSTMGGAPVLASGAGLLKAVLDACLTAGFGTKTLTSLTYDPLTGLCTGTFATPHGFLNYQVIEINGAEQAEYQGEQRITWASSTQIKFAPAYAPSVLTATGTITARTPPLTNWVKAFEATNKAMYTSVDPASNGLLLYMDDTNTVSWPGTNFNSCSYVFGVESATDILTYSGAYGAGYVRKDELQADASGREWLLIGDELMFYLFTWPNSSGAPYRPGAATLHFGQFLSFRPGDAFGTILVNGTNGAGSTSWSTSYFGDLNASSNKTVARPYSQLPTGAVAVSMRGHGISSYLGYNTALTSPNPPDNGIYIHDQVVIVEGTSIRGEMPGLKQLLHTAPFTHLQVQADLPGREGHPYLPVSIGNSGNSFTLAQALFDLNGWR
jgi:hypothetical protein